MTPAEVSPASPSGGLVYAGRGRAPRARSHLRRETPREIGPIVTRCHVRARNPACRIRGRKDAVRAVARGAARSSRMPRFVPVALPAAMVAATLAWFAAVQAREATAPAAAERRVAQVRPFPPPRLPRPHRRPRRAARRLRPPRCSTGSPTRPPSRRYLRHLPQRARQGRRAVAGGVRCRQAAATIASVAEKMIRKLRAGMMPPAGAQASRRAGRSPHGSRALEARIDAAAARNPNARLAAVPAPQPRRVHPRRARTCSALDVDVTALLPADTISARLRQRRRRADLLADADGGLPARGRPDQPPGPGRPRRAGPRGHLPRAARPRRRCSTSRARRSARAAASR